MIGIIGYEVHSSHCVGCNLYGVVPKCKHAYHMLISIQTPEVGESQHIVTVTSDRSYDVWVCLQLTVLTIGCEWHLFVVTHHSSIARNDEKICQLWRSTHKRCYQSQQWSNWWNQGVIGPITPWWNGHRNIRDFEQHADLWRVTLTNF